jgi:hypothetical protein
MEETGIIVGDTVHEVRAVRPTSLLEYLQLTTAITEVAVDEGVYDLIFARVLVDMSDITTRHKESVDRLTFMQKTTMHRSAAVMPMENPLALVNGKAVPFTYVEVAAWLASSQADAFRYMALAVHLDLCRLVTPYDVQPDMDEVTAQLLARMGMLAIVVLTPE